MSKKQAPWINLPKLRRSRVQITLWGSPLWKTYRIFFREMDVLARDARIVMQHHHHGLQPEDDGELRCAEIIEACEALPARRRALLWFVAHGRAGLGVEIDAISAELQVAALDLTQAIVSGMPQQRVARDLDEARALALPAGLVVVANGKLFTGSFDAMTVLKSAVEGS